MLGEDNQSPTRTIVRSVLGTAIWGIGSGPLGGGLAGVSAEGVGVLASSPSGYGLRVARGRIKVDEAAGIATVPRRLRGVVVDPGLDINADTVVLVTPASDLGKRSFWVRKDTEEDVFVIRVSAPTREPLEFNWLIVEKG